MKICIIVDDYLPLSKKVAGKMMHELAVEFILRGHTVTVITPDSDLNRKFETSKLDGVTVCRFNSGKIKNVSKLKRAINETLLPYRAWQVCKFYFYNNPHDLIVYYSPTIFWGHLVGRLKKIWGASSYLVLRDFYPQMFIDEGLIGNHSPIAYYFRFFEWLSYRAADKIAIESPKNLDWFSRKKCINKPLTLLYNWAADTPVSSESSHYRYDLGLENKVVFFYGGNIGPQQDMMNIVRLAKAMRLEQKAHFVLVGAGFAVELVRDAMQKDNLKNMTLLPPVSQEEFKRMLSEFDVGLFSLNRNHTTHNIPGKLLGYMVQGKPILGSINPNNDLQDILGKAGAGLITINGDDKAFLNNALNLMHDSDLRKTMGQNAKRLLKNVFSVQEAAKIILTNN
jgi:glycosyltransferase involved in cell wall biosynthesis